MEIVNDIFFLKIMLFAKKYRMRNLMRVLGIVGLLFISACSKNNDNSIVEEIYSLSIAEPSGLSYSADKQAFYTVSDRGAIYKISFTGKTIKQLHYMSDDFEGITVNPNNNRIYIIKERVGKLVELDSDGWKINTYKIIGDSGNSGLEGITYDTTRNLFYMLKEKNPNMLITYSLEKGITKQISLDFALDYSGIFYNETTDKLWIVSDESNTLTRCDLDGNALKSYKLNNLRGIEGVVVNADETEAYIVSDPSNKMYKLNLVD